MVTENGKIENPELLGFVPAIAAAITGAVNLGTTIAGGVAGKKQQERAIMAQRESDKTALEIAKIKIQQNAGTLQTAALIGIPAIIGFVLIMKKRKANNTAKGRKR